jgi:ribose-phosphate pyrophosphokinase
MTISVHQVPASGGDHGGCSGFAGSLAVQPGMVAGKHVATRFANGNLIVEVDPAQQREVQARVVTVAPTVRAGEDLVEFALLVDALARCSSRPIVVVLQYVPYSRSCRLTAPGQGLGAAAFLRMLESAPIDHVVTFDLHARELVGFFTKPVTALTTLHLLGSRMPAGNDVIVVGPDRGRYDDCRDLAATMSCSFDLLLKVRDGHDDRSRLLGGFGADLTGRPVVLYDDEITRGLTAMHALDALADAGADEIRFATPYDFATPEVRAKVLAAPGMRAMVTTNLGRPTTPHDQDGVCYEVIDAAPFAAAELTLLIESRAHV